MQSWRLTSACAKPAVGSPKVLCSTQKIKRQQEVCISESARKPAQRAAGELDEHNGTFRGEAKLLLL